MRRPLIWASLAAAMSTALSQAGGPTVILYVDDDAPEGGDGYSWQTAYRDLQDALDAARCLDPVEIRVAGGVYVPSGYEDEPRERFLVDALRGGCGVRLNPPGPSGQFDSTGPQFYADESVGGYPNLSSVVFSIRGAFAGLSRPDTPDLQDPEQFVTVLSGDRNGDDQPDFENRWDNCRRVLEIHSSLGEDTLLVEHCEIRGAWSRSWHDQSGGGVYISSSSGAVSLNHCRITDNQVDLSGGGAQVVAGRLTQFYRCEFTHNEARYGGALLTQSYTIIDRCVFSRNEADESGGAISNLDGAYCVKSIFADNSASNGGAIDGEASAHSCLFLGNQANQGGAVWGPRGQFFSCTFIQSNAPHTDLSIDEWAGFRNCIIVTNSSASMVRAAGISFMNSMIDNVLTAFETDDGQVDWEGSFVAPPRFLDPLGPDGNAATWQDNDYRPGPGSAALDAATRDHRCYNSFDAASRPRYIDAYNYADLGESCHFDRPIMDLGPYEASADTPRFCNADWNGDEVADFQDALAYLADFDAPHPGADLNSDSLWDFFDLQLFLRDYAAGCP